ncbi:MAG: aldo/keto reductase [Povalibacter sp.]
MWRTAISKLGFGGSGLGNLYQVIPEEQAHAALLSALAAGLTYVDTAPHYGFGLSEKRAGEALSLLDPKEKVVLSTKVGRLLGSAGNADLSVPRQGFISPEPFESVFDYSYDAVLQSFDESSARLRRRIDVLYVHDIGRRTHGDRHPALFRQFITEGYRAMRKLRDDGAVAAIGIGVNECEVCEEALSEAEFDVILLAGRYTLLEQGALDRFFPLCEKRGVSVVIGGPYNSGILARGVRGQTAPKYDYQSAPTQVVQKVAAIEEVCDRHSVPLAAAALQFPLAHPQVISVVPGMSSPQEVQQATSWLSHKIPNDFWTELRDRGLVRSDAPIPVAA